MWKVLDELDLYSSKLNTSDENQWDNIRAAILGSTFSNFYLLLSKGRIAGKVGSLREALSYHHTSVQLHPWNLNLLLLVMELKYYVKLKVYGNDQTKLRVKYKTLSCRLKSDWLDQLTIVLIQCMLLLHSESNHRTIRLQVYWSNQPETPNFQVW